MKTKHIILACIMPMALVPIYAQTGGVNAGDPTPLEKSSVPDVHHEREQEKPFQGIEAEESKDTAVIKDTIAAERTSSYEWTPQSENQSNWDLIALCVAIVALLVAGYNYITLQPKKNNRRERLSRQQDQTSTDRDLRNKMIRSNQDLHERIMELTYRIENLESQQRVAFQVQHNNLTSPIHEENSFDSSNKNVNVSNENNLNKREIKMYASQVWADCFPEEGLMEKNSDYVIAILSLKGDSGSFVINDRTQAQPFLINNFSYGAGRVSDVKEQGDSPTRIETIQPGSIYRQGNVWKITANAQVRLI